MQKIDSIRRAEVGRMLSMSREYYLAAEILSGDTAETGLSAMVLRSLAFEIALKAMLRSAGNTKRFSHRYKAAWQALPEILTKAVLADARALGDECILLSQPEVLLEAWEVNFVKARYLYEIDEEKSDEAVTASVEEWLSNGVKDEDADFRFYPFEHKLMIEALHLALERVLAA